MRIFGIDNNDLVPYDKRDFKINNTEVILENWFENNPLAIFEDEEVLIIGRQVITNLGKAIDLLGIDKNGNAVIIELKREKTPRETVAQILEYASFIDRLDYVEIEEIAAQYFNEENFNLLEQHKNFFKSNKDTPVAFNKKQRLVIVGQNIAKEIEQTSVFLNKKGLEINCLEFKYFMAKSGKQIISSDFIVKKDETSERIRTGSKPKINKKIFLENVDNYLKDFFISIFKTANKNKMPIHWGSTGFSLNVNVGGNHVNILYGYSKITTVGGQSIYTAVMEIKRKVDNADSIISEYLNKLKSTNLFVPARNEIKWLINRPVDKDILKKILDAILKVKDRILEEELVE